MVSSVGVHGILGARQSQKGNAADVKTECFKHWKCLGEWVVRQSALIRCHRIAHKHLFYLELWQMGRNSRSFTRREEYNKTYPGGRMAEGTHQTTLNDPTHGNNPPLSLKESLLHQNNSGHTEAEVGHGGWNPLLTCMRMGKVRKRLSMSHMAINQSFSIEYNDHVPTIAAPWCLSLITSGYSGMLIEICLENR